MTVVRVLVLWKSPQLHLRTDVGRHAVVGRETPEQSLLIPVMVFDNLPPPLA